MGSFRTTQLSSARAPEADRRGILDWRSHDRRELGRTCVQLVIFALAVAAGLAVSMGGGVFSP